MERNIHFLIDAGENIWARDMADEVGAVWKDWMGRGDGEVYGRIRRGGGGVNGY